MTVSTTDSAPAAGADTTAGGAAAGEGQAPSTNTSGRVDPDRDNSSNNADRGTAAGDRQHEQRPRGRRDPTEQVRSAARDDEHRRPPSVTFQDGTDTAGRPAGDRDGGGDAGRAGKADDWNIDDLPPGAQKLIADLRKENGTRRTEATEAKKAREAAEAKVSAADERFATATEALMRALGLTPEPEEQRSPEEQLAEVTTQYRQSRIELAVYRAAGAHDGDPDALLDSRAFLTKAFALDPGDSGFDQAIAAAIGEAVAANPKLRARSTAPAVVAAPSGGDFGGGPAERNDRADWSVDDFRRARHSQRGN